MNDPVDTGEPMPIPDAVMALIGVTRYEEEGGFAVEHGYIWTTCAAVENANPLFWDDDVAATLTGGPIAPPPLLSVWFRHTTGRQAAASRPSRSRPTST